MMANTYKMHINYSLNNSFKAGSDVSIQHILGKLSAYPPPSHPYPMDPSLAGLSMFMSLT